MSNFVRIWNHILPKQIEEHLRELYWSNLCCTQLNFITFPWKDIHSGAHPPLGIAVGAIVALMKLLLLLQIEGSSKPQLISFQYPMQSLQRTMNT